MFAPIRGPESFPQAFGRAPPVGGVAVIRFLQPMRVRGLPGILVFVGLLLFVLPSAAGFYTDWLWFQQLGYGGVFTRTLNAQTTVFALTFAVVFLFLYLNMRLAGRRTVGRPKVVLGTGADGRPVTVDVARAADTARPIAAVLALLIGLMGASRWFTWLSYLNAASFGTSDPLQGRDVSFYVFTLPVLDLLRQQATIVAVVALIGCALLYVFSGSFVIESRPSVSPWPRIRLVPVARRHLSLLTALVLLLLAWGSWIEIPRTLVTATDAQVAFGASYADVYARIPFHWASVIVLVIGAALSIWHGFGQRAWPLPLAIVSYVMVSAGGGVYAGIIQRLVVEPNEFELERPFLEHNIRSTREAYRLDQVEERSIAGDAELSAGDVIDNAATIENLRLWDHDQLLQTFGQIQIPKPYYDFRNIDNDRYDIGGRKRQVMLSVRELNAAALQPRSWVNERLRFTHGFGLTLGPVNQMTTEGLPVLYIQNIPPQSSVKIPVTQPSVYFGEASNDYVLVGTRQKEFHYPLGDATGGEGDDAGVSTEYDGTGGVPIGSFMRRLLFAVRFWSTDILVTAQLTSNTRILFHRNIVERAQLLAPFLTLDGDPYPVIHDGRIVWIQDGYTTSRNYPYASPNTAQGRLSGVNYIRNAVKLVTDAYHGSVALYVSEPDDPIIRTVDRIFPGMLKPIDEMPRGLRAHVRYPEDIFLIQAEKYATYHMTNPQAFYSSEDLWQRPVLESGPQQSAVLMEPYYTVMRLPGEKDVEFIQMLPFTPNRRDNLAAWIAARSDGTHYGKLIAFQLPKRNVFGPRQIVARINQDQKISPQITLWSQQGSQVVLGTLLVIPIKESLIYVRPLYLRSSQGKIPELKKVIVAYQSQIVMADTLRQALADIFGASILRALEPDQLAASTTSVVAATEPASGASTATPPDADTTTGSTTTAGGADATMAALVAEAAKHNEAADAALKAGDVVRYAEEIRSLQDVVRRMQAAR